MLQVKDLMSYKTLSRLTLVAGKAGLFRRVTCVSIAMMRDMGPWLSGGDVLIVSGCGVGETGDLLLVYLKTAQRRNASCIIAYLSEEYIPGIPDSAKKLADKFRIPLFAVSWNTKISDIIQNVQELVFNAEREDRTDDIWQVLMQSDQRKQLINYANTLLLPLIEYDQCHESELLITLQTYFLENGKQIKTADALGISRGTLISRLLRIEDLTGKLFTDMRSYHELYNAVRIYTLSEGSYELNAKMI
ncbi:MAG: PucR family transcriptional regulator [Peptococcaceae bacterium]|nr:PucR family transcriptional regulator [Peptococcaceae bacterium]